MRFKTISSGLMIQLGGISVIFRVKSMRNKIWCFPVNLQRFNWREAKNDDLSKFSTCLDRRSINQKIFFDFSKSKIARDWPYGSSRSSIESCREFEGLQNGPREIYVRYLKKIGWNFKNWPKFLNNGVMQIPNNSFSPNQPYMLYGTRMRWFQIWHLEILNPSSLGVPKNFMKIFWNFWVLVNEFHMEGVLGFWG